MNPDIKTQYRKPGETLPYTNASGSTIAGGTPLVVAGRVGIAQSDIANGATDDLQVVGIFEARKVTGAVVAGQRVGWDANGSPVGGTASSGAYTIVAANWDFEVGTVVEAAASGDESLKLALNSFPNAGAGGLWANTDWLASVTSSIDMTAAEPASPVVGDRYFNSGTGASSATAQTVAANRIYEWNGTNWTETIPTEGAVFTNEDTGVVSAYDGASWVNIGTFALLGEAQTFFGLTDITGAEAEILTDGSNADALHVHCFTAAIPVEDLTVGVDISARAIFCVPERAVTLVSVGILTQFAPTAVDDDNTSVVLVTDDAANVIVTKTYNTGTQPPTADYESLGALDVTHKVLAAGEHLLLSITNGTTADLNALSVIVVYQ